MVEERRSVLRCWRKHRIILHGIFPLRWTERKGRRLRTLSRNVYPLGENPPLVIVEVHVEKLPEFGFTPEDLMALFPASRFYQFVVPHSLQGIHSADLKCGVAYAADVLSEWPFYSNLIAVPKIGRFGV